MDLNKLKDSLMIIGNRKIVIAAIIILLIVGIMIVIDSVMARKSAVPVWTYDPNVKSVKKSKPVVSKTVIKDKTPVKDSNEAEFADGNEPQDEEFEFADNDEVFVADNTKETGKPSTQPVSLDYTITDIDQNDGPMTDILPEAELKSAALSADIGIAGSGIQSLVFMRQMPIVDALQLLAAKYGHNIIPSTKVTGNLAFTRLNNVSFEEAMNAILGSEFKYKQEGNIVRVYASAETDKYTPQAAEMTCKVFTLYYITAAEARKMVSPVMSSSGRVQITTAAETGVPVDETVSSQKGGGDTLAINDMMVICDYPEQISQIEQIISTIDIRPKQVLVEATILTATLTDGMQFGIDWRNLGLGTIATVTGLSSLSRGSPDYGSFSGTSTNVGASISGGLTVGIVRGDIATFIRAIEEITDVTILANPKILATNKQLGQVYIGTKVAYQSATTQTETSTTQQVDFLDTGTKLSFRPYIGDDGYIRMDIHPKDSSASIRTVGSVAMPDETSAELVTNIIVRNGETIVIGGLFRNKIHMTKKQVPVLGNIPIIGTAFKSNADETKREEVIILLTPHIIEEPKQARGSQRAEDIARKTMGAKEELHPTNRMKIAQNHYEKAALYYAQDRNSDAIKELKKAIELYPAYLEAIQLEEKIYKETDSTTIPVREIIDEAEKPYSDKWRRR